MVGTQKVYSIFQSTADARRWLMGPPQALSGDDKRSRRGDGRCPVWRAGVLGSGAEVCGYGAHISRGHPLVLLCLHLGSLSTNHVAVAVYYTSASARAPVCPPRGYKSAPAHPLDAPVSSTHGDVRIVRVGGQRVRCTVHSPYVCSKAHPGGSDTTNVVGTLIHGEEFREVPSGSRGRVGQGGPPASRQRSARRRGRSRLRAVLLARRGRAVQVDPRLSPC